MNSQGSSKSLLPLVEIIISIGIFAVAVVLTLQLFLLAKFLGDKTSDTARAIFEIQNIAENIKLLKTDAEIENYIYTDKVYFGYYDSEWQKTLSEDDAAFIMKIDMDKDGYASGNLYKFTLELYKADPYPFINDKNVKIDSEYKPLLASINTSRYVISE